MKLRITIIPHRWIKGSLFKLFKVSWPQNPPTISDKKCEGQQWPDDKSSAIIATDSGLSLKLGAVLRDFPKWTVKE